MTNTWKQWICRVVFSGGLFLFLGIKTLYAFGTPITYHSTFKAGLNSPQGVFVTSTGEVLVTEASGTLKKFDLNGDSVMSIQGLQYPMGVVVDRNGFIYVSEFEGGTVKKFDSNGANGVTLISGLNGPAHVAVDVSGNVYVCESASSNIKKFTSTGTLIWTHSGIYSYGIAVNGLGEVVVADLHEGSIVKLSEDGQTATPLITGIDYPKGVVLDKLGNIFLSESGSYYNSPIISRARKFTSTGLFGGIFGREVGSDNDQLYHPNGIFVDSRSRIYVADTDNGRIQILSQPDSVPPDPPTNVQAAASGTSVVLRWTNPSDIDFGSVVIERGTDTNFTDSVTVTTNAIGSSYTDMGLTRGASYYYRLRARDVSDNYSSYTDTVRADIAQLPTQVAPTSFGVLVTGATATLSWHNPDVFEGLILTRQLGDAEPMIITQNTRVNTVTQTGLEPGVYVYRLVAVGVGVVTSNAVVATATVVLNDAFLEESQHANNGTLDLVVSSNTVINNPKFGDAGFVTVNLTVSKVSLNTQFGLNGGTGVLLVTTQNASWTDQGDFSVGKSGVGKVIQSDGVVQVVGTLTLGKDQGSSGNYQLSGGTLRAGTLAIGGSGSGSMSWTGGTLDAGQIQGRVTNNGGVLTVRSGTPVRVAGRYAQTALGRIRVILNSSPVRSLLSAGVGLKTPLTATPSALLTVTQTLVLGGTLTVELDGYSPQVGDTFKVLEAGTQENQFATVTLPTLPSQFKWDQSALYTSGNIRILSTSSSILDSRPLNYPNPFQMRTQGTRIGYLLNRDANLELRVYMSTGKEIFRKSFVSGINEGQAGYRFIDVNSQTVGDVWPAGMYPYVIISDGVVVGKGRMGVTP